MDNTQEVQAVLDYVTPNMTRKGFNMEALSGLHTDDMKNLTAGL